MSTSAHVRYSFFYLLLLAVLALNFAIFSPYIITLAIATTFAVVMQPVYLFSKKYVKAEIPAALLTVLILGLVIFIPLTLIGVQVGQEASALYELISNSNQLKGNVLAQLETTLNSYISPYAPGFELDLIPIIRQTLTFITANVGTVFKNTLQFFLHFFLGTIAFYYLLKDGTKFLEILIDLSPLSEKNDSLIVKRLSNAINSIIKGSLLIAFLQGLVSGIGFMLFSVPSPTLWGTLAGIGAMIPGVGTSIVIIPAVVYLFLIGSTFKAIGLIVWGVIAVGLIDNFLGPIFVGRGVRIHPLFILFAVIGGINMFGPLGFVLGPLSLSLLYALLDIYRLLIGDGRRTL